MKVTKGSKKIARNAAMANGINGFTSAVELGNKYRLFFKVFKDEEDDEIQVLSVGFPARKLDNRLKCGSVFVLGDDTEQNPVTLQYIDNSGLAPYSRISNVLHRAECEMEKFKIESTKKAEAQAMGEDVNSPKIISDIAVAVQKTEMKYFGDRDTSTSPTVRQLIGGVSLVAFTEMIIVPLSSTDVPVWDKAEHVSWDISSSRKKNMLNELVENASFCNVEDGYVEIHLNYGMGAKSKQEAGQNLTLQGVPSADRLSTLYPEDWAKFASKLNDITDDAEVMAGRCPAVRFSKSAEEVVESMKKLVSTQPLTLRKIDFESAAAKKSARDFIDSGIAAIDEVAQGNFIALIEKEDKTEAADTAADEGVIPSAVMEASKATTLSEMAEIMEGSTGESGDLSPVDDGIDLI